ncbi:unnamed protein product [Diamesa serratosioi]
MNKEIFGVKVNLINVAITVALYDIVHILYGFWLKFSMFQMFDRHDIGCHLDAWASHCIDLYLDVIESVANFLLCVLLIFGTSMLKKNYVLLWIIMSTYNLGYLSWFFYEYSMHLEHLPIYFWINITISIMGYVFIVYFYIKLRSTDIKAIQRERLGNVKDMDGVAFEAY